MNKKTTTLIGLAGAATIAGALWLTQRKPVPLPKPPPEPECAANISYPERLVGQLEADGRWHAYPAIRPPNAPCWIWYVPVATDRRGMKSVPAGQPPVIIHIK